MLSNLGLEGTKRWILSHSKGMVCCCTINELSEASEDKDFRKKLWSADLLTADGMPLVWYLKWKDGWSERVYGPDLLKEMLINNKDGIVTSSRRGRTPRNDVNIGNIFVGDQKNKGYFEKFGEYIVMPYKEQFDKEDYDWLAKEIGTGGNRIIWLGLGGKKQVETAWELKKRRVSGVVVTVGAAFDFLSGNKRQAPRWLRNIGGEWLFRLVTEPKRLWKRYFRIARFIVKVLRNRYLGNQIDLIAEIVGN